MPIYAYKCDSCGHAKDVLQKMSDPTLTDCPQCGAATFKKQLTSAGFQLKGSGWYVTDFRDNKGAGDKAKDASGADKAAPATTTSETASASKSDTAVSPATASAPAAAKTVAAPAASAAPAPKAST